MAEMRRTCTETLVVSHRKGLPVRLFGENAFAAHGIVQVSRKTVVDVGVFGTIPDVRG